MAQPEKFWNKIAKKYAAQAIAHPQDYQKKLEFTAELLQPTMNVLEFGCGTGGTAVQHAPLVLHYRALDISSAMLDFGRAKAQQAGIHNIDFDVATIESVPLEDNSLDVVLGMSILHLLEDKDAVIAKIFRALRPGGYFVSSTMCLQSGYAWLKLVAPVGHFFGLLPLVRIFSPESLRDAITHAGFELTKEWLPAKKRALFLIAQKPA